MPAIQGDAVVGATLTAVATWTGEPPPTVKYAWSRCPATGGACPAITAATAVQYDVTAADLGSRLRVKITLKNRASATSISALSVTTELVVPAPAPTPVATPVSPPGPLPDAEPAPEARASFAEPVAPIVNLATSATLLRPFPVVRIRGYFQRGGVRVTLLSVNAPRSAHITARCVGRGCPKRTVSVASAPARLRVFERFLPAGTVLQVRVTRAGSIGKYASFRIRANSAPVRTDLCLMPSGTKPVACPSR